MELPLIKTLFGIGIGATLVTLLGTLVKGIVNSGLYVPGTFATVMNGTLLNMQAWGSAVGPVILAMLGVLLVFVTLRIVVTLL